MNLIINKLYTQQALSQAESYQLFDNIIKGNLDATLLSGLLIALKIKGETPQEIAGAASALLSNALAFPKNKGDVADIVGTGGDNANTINVSTTAAFVVASCGYKIAKHGNRGVSSQSGSSDLLEQLGINLSMSPEQANIALQQLNICFLFAPQYHSGFRHAAPVRQALKTRTIFNLLGPLINPAKPNIQLMGVYDKNLVRPMAEALVSLGLKRAAVVHGSGLDEVAIHGQTEVAEINNGQIDYYTLTPRDFGLNVYSLDEIKGGTPQYNAQITRNILNGQGSMAQNSAIAINSALLLKLFGQEDLKHNAQQALEIMASGSANKLVDQLSKFNSCFNSGSECIAV